MLNKINYLLVGIVFISCILAVVWSAMEIHDRLQEPYKEEIKLAGIAPPVFEYAHAYHGVLTSHWSKEKKCYVFERDGIECKLFTKAFWMWYNEKWNKDRKE